MDLDHRQTADCYKQDDRMAINERDSFALVGAPLVAGSIFVARLADITAVDYTQLDQHILLGGRIFASLVIVGFFMISTYGRVVPRLLVAGLLCSLSYLLSLIAGMMSGTPELIACAVLGALMARVFLKTQHRNNC